MGVTFSHLHVASSYSLRYGVSSPQVLVDAARDHGMRSLALTDRDGLYGAVKFVRCCAEAGIDPVVGVDLAHHSSGILAGLPEWAVPDAAAAVRHPVRGGAALDPRHPRVTVLAVGADPAAGVAHGAGWRQLCRLVTAVQLQAQAAPVGSVELIAAHAHLEHREHRGEGSATEGPAALVVMLGPDSDFGRAVRARRYDLAVAVLRDWQSRLPRGALVVEVVHHRGHPRSAVGVGQAVRMSAVARRCGVPVVLTNAVRHVDRGGAVTADVLDAARRLVILGSRHLDQVTAEGYLAPAAEMARRAEEIAVAADDPRTATALLADTQTLAERCRQDAVRDLGFGAVHLPEGHLVGVAPGQDTLGRLRDRCLAAIETRYPTVAQQTQAGRRLAEELAVIGAQDIAGFFLTVAQVCDLIRQLGVRVAARGSGAGSLVNHLLGISGVDPLRYGLLMERFFTPGRTDLPDIDIDVESARRGEVYERILEHFGAERVTCVSMMDTYRVRHALRDVGAALGLPPGEIDLIAKAFPHIRARDVRHALADLPELRSAGLSDDRHGLLLDLVERLDGLPRHVALHPCAVVLSGVGLLDRTPVQASGMGFPMSQFDKDDVETMGMLKLDVLGIRMQSAMAYAVQEIARVDGADAGRVGKHPADPPYLGAEGTIDLDAVPLDDERTYRMIRTTRTLGCFQIESPGQRELIGRFGPESFDDLIIDISLFRPGPVKSDMIQPFLQARQGWRAAEYLHPRLRPALAETHGVVVFHEQVLRILHIVTGCGLDEADEIRRAMGTPAGQEQIEPWFTRRALAHGFAPIDVTRIWSVLQSFASFGFCKAHAAAFAVPTYQSAWLKTHHPAAFLAGVLTHDPGMYPKRLLLDDARNLGIAVLGLDINHSHPQYRVERLEAVESDRAPVLDPDLPDGRGYGIRVALNEVKGINAVEVARIVEHRPYRSLSDFWHRAAISRPVVERLVMAGAFDGLHGIGQSETLSRERVTRRDLMLHLAELGRWKAPVTRSRARSASRDVPSVGLDPVRTAAARQSRAAQLPESSGGVQLALDVGCGDPDRIERSGLPDLSSAERVRVELDVLGLDASRHVMDFYVPLLDALGVVRARDVRRSRNRTELLVAGVKVATQTPPVRSGRRVVFLTLDDATGPVDATFFEDVQGPYAGTVFQSWLLVVQGVLRRSGPRGAALRATGAWEIPVLWEAWTGGGLPAVHAVMQAAVGCRPQRSAAMQRDVPVGIGQQAPGRTLGASRDDGALPAYPELGDADAASGLPVGDRRGPQTRRLLVHPSGFQQSPYADLRPSGEDPRSTRGMLREPGSRTRERSGPERKLWHSSPGSSGR